MSSISQDIPFSQLSFYDVARNQASVMDWDSRKSSTFSSDLEKLNYSPREITVITASKANVKWQKQNEITLQKWLKNVVNARSNTRTSGLWVIFCDRAEELERNPLVLMDVPFSEKTFREVRKSFWVNVSIIRALNRGVAVFTRTQFNDEVPETGCISYNLRTSTSEGEDLAISITTDPTRCLTYAIVYGSTIFSTKIFYSRLKESGDSIEHPMLLLGIFAEMQRDKHGGTVKEKVAGLLEHVINVGKNTLPKKPFGNDMEDGDDEEEQREFVDLWLDVSYLRSTLATWKAQLQKIVSQVDELTSKYFETRKFVDSNETEASTGRPDMAREGLRIKERLLDIIIEYDEMERKCAWVIDGTSLANGLSWNHLARQDNKLNTQIAMSSKRDSTQMKSIALLTMVFLPGTYVATFFTMPLFNWHPDDSKGEVVYNTNYFWLYWVAVSVLTSSVVATWLLASHGKQFWVFVKSKGERAKVPGAKKAIANTGTSHQRHQAAGRFFKRNKKSTSSESSMANEV